MGFSGIILGALFSISPVAESVDCQPPKDLSSGLSSLKNVIPKVQKAALLKSCARREAYFSQTKPSATQSAINAAAKSKAKVIVVGESHSEDSALFYPWMLKKLKSQRPDLDCVFIEQPTDQYATKFAACNDKSSECKKSALPEFSGIKAAYEMGLKVFPVDAVPHPDAQDFLGDVKKRNLHMAAESTRLLQKDCKAAVLIMGALHGHRNQNLPSVPELLSAQKISHYGIELFSPGKDTFGNVDSYWDWGASACPSSRAPRKQNFAYIHGPEAKGVDALFMPFTDPFSDRRELVGKVGDYDAAIAIGCGDPTKLSCR